MSTIHLARASENLGAFSIDEVQAGLNSGRFHPTDLYWQTGMANWMPLDTFTAEVTLNPIRPEPEWERRKETGLLKAYFSTVLASIFRTRATYTDLRKDSSAAGAIGFYAITTIASTALTCIWHYYLPSAHTPKTVWLEKLPSNVSPEAATAAYTALTTLILGPLIISINIIAAHYILKGLASDDPIEGIKTTTKAYLYPLSSISVLFTVPVLALGMITPFAAIGLAIPMGLISWIITSIALARAHHTSTGKALAAYLISTILISIASGMIIGLLSAISVLNS